MIKFYLFKSFFTALPFLFAASITCGQGKTVTGTVTTATDGSGLAGVIVVENGTNNTTVTSADGTYSMNVSSGATLFFSLVGYKPAEAVVGNQSIVNVSLESDMAMPSDIVAIGYGQVDKRDVTGALVSLKPTDFNTGIISSPAQLIQGRAAGVQVTNDSGEPGAGVSVRIRGTSSVFGKKNPLFVIDGVPLSADDVSPAGQNGSLGTSSPRNSLNFLNPNDIASMDILKDASAAIYGSRGSNGVVLITTKSGKSGKGSLDYSYNLGISTITKKYELLNRDEFLSAYSSFNRDGAAIAFIDKGSSTDWQNEILRTAITQSHDLSYGGGDQTGNYRFSFGYMNQEGIIKNSGLDRYSLRFNGTKRFIDDRLKLATQFTVGTTHDDNVPITNDVGFEGDLIGSALKANPTAPVRTADGEFYQASTTEPNPAAILALSKDFTNTIRALGNISAEMQIVKGLFFKTVIGFDRSFSSRKTAFSRDLLVGGVKDMGRLYLNDMENDDKLWENYFTYDKRLSSHTKLNAILGYSSQSFSKTTRGMQLTDFRTSDLDRMINNLASADQKPANAMSAGVVATNSSNLIDRLQSFYGRVNFDFHDKYIVTGTLRADGSSKFSKKNKYGYFPSGSFRWRLSEEAFMPEASSDLSIRIGYGITGSQEIPYRYPQELRYYDWGLDYGGNVTGGGLGSGDFPNPDLKWESTAQFNAGIDYGFFNNRVRGSIDYYYKNTSDLLIRDFSNQPAVPPFVWKNIDANVINKGVEISLEGDVVASNNFKWTVIGNVAFNNNLLKNFGNSSFINMGTIHGNGLTGAFAQRIANNHPLYSFFVLEFAGYNTDGSSRYSGDAVQQLVGKSPLPKVNAGLTNNFRYKSFDLSVFFSGQFGQYVYSNTANAYFTANAISNGRNVTKDVVNNGEGKLNAPYVSTRFLYSASFARLQNVTLGYNMNMQNKFLSFLRLFVTAQNVFTITSYPGQDPEVDNSKVLNGSPAPGIDYSGYPRAKSITIGVNASF
jgi:iron complex outermembrane receptor protein